MSNMYPNHIIYCDPPWQRDAEYRNIYYERQNQQNMINANGAIKDVPKVDNNLLLLCKD